MDFSYRFLIVCADQTQLDGISEAIRSNFPASTAHTCSDIAEAADYCRANVYDLIISDGLLAGTGVGGLSEAIKELKNDNTTTGILALGKPISPVGQLSHIMFVDSLDDESFMSCAKTLISLK